MWLLSHPNRTIFSIKQSKSLLTDIFPCTFQGYHQKYTIPKPNTKYKLSNANTISGRRKPQPGQTQIQTLKFQIHNAKTKHKIQNANCKILNTQFQIPNTPPKYQGAESLSQDDKILLSRLLLLLNPSYQVRTSFK